MKTVIIMLLIGLAAACTTPADQISLEPTPTPAVAPLVADGNGRPALPDVNPQAFDLPTAGAVELELPPLVVPEPDDHPEVEVIVVPPAAPCTIEATILNSTLGFAVNDHTISPEGRAVLIAFVTDAIHSQDDGRELFTAVARGHASSEGQLERNRELSGLRAESVASIIQTLLPPGITVTTEHVGISEPVLDEDGMEDRAASRRVELQLTFEGCES